MADPLRRQVRSESRLRYGGSLADLLSARHTAHRQYQNDVSTAHENASALKKAARDSIPELKAIYDDADRTRQNAAAQIDKAVGIAGSSNSALASALMGERGIAEDQMASERAAAQAEAVSRGRDAVAGEVYAKRNALENYRSTRSDLMSRTRDIHREQGAFEQSRLGELQDQQAKADFDMRKFLADTTGIDPATGKPTLQGRKTEAEITGIDPLTGKPLRKPRTRSEEIQVRKDTAASTAEIKRARVWIRQLLSKGGDAKTVKNLLIQGGSLPTTIEYTGTNSKGEKVKKVRTKDIPVPAFDPDLVRAAFELEGGGYLSDASVHSLRTTHNVHIPKQWLPTRAKKKLSRTKNQAAKTVTQEVKKVAGILGNVG